MEHYSGDNAPERRMREGMLSDKRPVLTAERSRIRGKGKKKIYFVVEERIGEPTRESDFYGWKE